MGRVKRTDDRVKRTEAVLPLDKGGLNMPDIGSFWESLKCSWTRRLLNIGASWHKILQANILYSGYELEELIFEGPEVLRKCAAKLTNLFWKECFFIFAKLVTKIGFHRPDFFFNMNIFDSENFMYGGNMVRKFDFPILWSKNVRQIGDFYDCQTTPPKLLELNELNEKFSMNLNFLRYHHIKTSIINGARKLNFKIFNPNISDVQIPRLPLLFKIGIVQPKGCNFFYKVLRSEMDCLRNAANSEKKWQESLATTFSIAFWDKIYKLPKKYLVSNKNVWVQIQLNKHLLPTNYSVSHYDARVSPACSFCSAHFEKLHMLFWGCGVVQEFWLMVGNHISNYHPEFILGKKEALFGDQTSMGSSPVNTILNIGRYFIWRQKFSKKTLDEIDFILYTNYQLNTIVESQKLKNTTKKFTEFVKDWGYILDHFQV